jgi:hypothetical protein
MDCFLAPIAMKILFFFSLKKRKDWNVKREIPSLIKLKPFASKKNAKLN